MNMIVRFTSLYDVENKRKIFSHPVISMVDYEVEEFEKFWYNVSVTDNIAYIYNDAFREFREDLPYRKEEFNMLVEIDKISIKNFTIFIDASTEDPISMEEVKELLPNVEYSVIQKQHRTMRVIEISFNSRKILMYDGYESHNIDIFQANHFPCILIPCMESDTNPDIQKYSEDDAISFIDEYGFWNQGMIREVSSYPTRMYGIRDIKNEYHPYIHHDMILNVYDDSCEEFKNERQLILDSIAI